MAYVPPQEIQNITNEAKLRQIEEQLAQEYELQTTEIGTQASLFKIINASRYQIPIFFFYNNFSLFRKTSEIMRHVETTLLGSNPGILEDQIKVSLYYKLLAKYLQKV